MADGNVLLSTTSGGHGTDYNTPASAAATAATTGSTAVGAGVAVAGHQTNNQGYHQLSVTSK